MPHVTGTECLYQRYSRGLVRCFPIFVQYPGSLQLSPERRNTSGVTVFLMNGSPNRLQSMSIMPHGSNMNEALSAHVVVLPQSNGFSPEGLTGKAVKLLVIRFSNDFPGSG